MRIRLVGPVGLMAAAVLAGCGSSTVTPEDQDPVPFLITGSSMGLFHQNVQVSRGDLSVEETTVAVNGVTLAQTSPGSFHGVLPAVVPVGSSITIVVSEDNVTATGTTTAMASPTLVAPLDASVHPAGAPLTVTWTSDEDPDEFLVDLGWVIDGNGYSARTEVAGDVREATVPTTAIPAAAVTVRLTVLAYRDGVFTGAAHPDSRMRVRVESDEHELNLTP